MATIRKRTTSNGTTSYHVPIRLIGYPPETASFERLTVAKTWTTKIKGNMRAGRHFGQSKPEGRFNATA